MAISGAAHIFLGPTKMCVEVEGNDFSENRHNFNGNKHRLINYFILYMNKIFLN